MAVPYVQAAKKQMRRWQGELPGSLDSVYVGGGTPTALETPLLEELLLGIRDSFPVEENAEWTVEANPGTVNEEKLLMLFRCGVNRLSFGVQSVHEKELAALGRIHGFAEVKKSIRLALECGFQNLSADLMFGIPHETFSSLRESILRVIDLGITHLSLYGLRIEEGTPFYDRRESLSLPGEDAEREMYLSSVELLRKLGFLQYEISNFALPGYASRHNLRYWRGEEYYGIGPGAHSYLAGRRFSVPPSLPAYLKDGALALKTVFTQMPPMTEEELLEEHIILSLRMNEGVSDTVFPRFKDRKRAETLFAKWTALRLADRKDGRSFFTPEGMLVSNSLLSDLLLCL